MKRKGRAGGTDRRRLGGTGDRTSGTREKEEGRTGGREGGKKGRGRREEKEEKEVDGGFNGRLDERKGSHG